MSIGESRAATGIFEAGPGFPIARVARVGNDMRENLIGYRGVNESTYNSVRDARSAALLSSAPIERRRVLVLGGSSEARQLATRIAADPRL
jgi:hypothetical protein